jgi:two-component system cell cycle sensor histidine kinase/response regulator CckA
MPGGGSLTIRTANCPVEGERPAGIPAGDHVMIEVTDTGEGIPPEVRQKIFEPFFTTKEIGKGTGLGLSTVFGIVNQSGGAIDVQSTVGEGTTFRIYLPRHEPGIEPLPEPLPPPRTVSERNVAAPARPAVPDDTEPKPASVETALANPAEPEADAKPSVPRAPEPPPKPATDHTGQGTVLLVEDEDPVRAVNSRALSARGYTVLEAASGIEALRLIEEHADGIDVVVSDVVMPEMDGPTLLRELRKHYPDLKVIFVSGYAEDAFRKNLPEGETFNFLPKPFSLKQLVEMVKRTMAS